MRLSTTLLDAYEDSTGGPVDGRRLAMAASKDALTADELVDTAQWSDLLVFDYLTGNYDR